VPPAHPAQPPIFEYAHDEAARHRGYVYRAGDSLVWGRFLRDYCSGRIWSFRYDGQTMTDFQEHTQDLAPWPGEGEIGLITSFGQDSQGELYILDNQNGEVFKIIEEVCEISNYCVLSPNSSGNGAKIGNTGSAHIQDHEFRLTAVDAPPNKYGIFFYGKEQDLAFFGDGIRCVKQPFYRLKPLVHLDAQGAGSLYLDFDNPPQSEARILPGSTWNFQFWFRDPAFGGTGFNTSDGLNVTFCP
jgi:hypothetical protein